LIHWADDEEVAQAENFAELYDILSARKANSTDDKKDGLISNFETDSSYFYLDTLTDLTGKPDVSGEILNFEEPDPVALQEINMIYDMLADIDALEDSDLGQYAGTVLFSEGHGSAVYGYSEFMAYINDVVDQLAIRTISHCDGEDVPLYFADVVSLCADVTDPVKRENCIKLMNLMTSEGFITKLSLGKGEAQYLLPARHAVYDTLEQVFPMYSRLYELVSDEENHIMRYNASVYEYLDNASERLGIE
jgi:thiamine pyridinylase